MQIIQETYTTFLWDFDPVSQYTGTRYQFHTQYTSTTCIWWWLCNKHHMNTKTPAQSKPTPYCHKTTWKRSIAMKGNYINFWPIKSSISWSLFFPMFINISFWVWYSFQFSQVLHLYIKNNFNTQPSYI